MEYIPSDQYIPLNTSEYDRDCNLRDEYCIRRVYLIKKEVIAYGSVWKDAHSDPIIRCYLTNEDDNRVLISPNHFKFTVYETTHFLYDVASTIEQLCEIKVPWDERFKILSTSAFEIVDTNNAKRTFTYSIKKLDNELYGMIVSEFLQYKTGYKTKPLQYVLTMTYDDGLNYVKSFTKCLKLNDIEIKKGKFDNEDLINAK